MLLKLNFTTIIPDKSFNTIETSLYRICIPFQVFVSNVLSQIERAVTLLFPLHCFVEDKKTGAFKLAIVWASKATSGHCLIARIVMLDIFIH